MEKIRFPSVVGQFYPAEKAELKKTIKEFLNKAESFNIEGKVFAILVPHAGYIFSGPVAAFGYKLLEGKIFDSVIIIGDSHYERFDGVSIWEKGKWQTPLGDVQVDEELAKEILKASKRFFVRDSAHFFEHSLEVQIPFLQIVLKKFKIVPILFGSENKDWQILAKTLLKLSEKKNFLIVASSDLSHYPSYETAYKVDCKTLNSILTCDPEKFSKKIKELEKKYSGIETFACSPDTVKTILEIAKKRKARAFLLKYQNSGELGPKEKKRVVGYSAIGFFN